MEGRCEDCLSGKRLEGLLEGIFAMFFEGLSSECLCACCI